MFMINSIYTNNRPVLSSVRHSGHYIDGKCRITLCTGGMAILNNKSGERYIRILATASQSKAPLRYFLHENVGMTAWKA